MKRFISSILATSMLLTTVVAAVPSVAMANEIEPTNTVIGTNIVQNPGFEDEDMSMWRVSSDIDFDSADVHAYTHAERRSDSERRSGSHAFGFNNEDDLIYPFSFTLEQDIVITTTGSYDFGMFLTGGDGSNRVIYTYIIVNGTQRYRQNTDLPGWGNWNNPTITDIDLVAGDLVTIGISLTSDQGPWPPWNAVWGAFDEFSFTLMSTPGLPDPVPSDIYVRRVDNMRDDFIRGVDIGSVLALEASGVVFRDHLGQPADLFELLADAGVNMVRVRIWNDPWYNQALFGRTRGFGGGNNDVETAMEIGRRATAAGMGVKLNFHYSDFWADPGKQQSPRAWQGMNLTQRTQALRDFTYETVSRAVNEGIDVWQVQLGNETNSAMAGVSGWNNMGPLFRAGSEAVRAVDPDIKIVIHFTNPENTNAFINHANQLANHNVDYDVFGASYYSFWHGTLANLTHVLTQISSNHDVDVMVVETSWAHTSASGDCHSNVVPNFTSQVIDYPISVQGQANAVVDVFRAVAEVPNQRGLGVIYWEPAWLPVPPIGQSASACAAQRLLWEEHGSGWASSWSAVYDPDDAGVWYGGNAWDNQALFDFNGNPLPSLNIFNYVQTGTVPRGGVVMETVLPTTGSLNFFNGMTPADILASATVPSTVTAVYIDNARRPVTVNWSQTQLQNAINHTAANGGIQNFTITGTVTEVATGNVFNAEMRLTIFPHNLVQNYSFESPDMSMWNINIATGAGLGNPTGNRVSRLQENVRSGNWGLNFFQSAQFDFTVEQEIVIEEDGYYVFEMFLQGGDGSNRNLYIYVLVNDEAQYRHRQQTDLGGWMNWNNPRISGIELYEGDVVTIGFRLQSGPGAWGTLDDFFLFMTESRDTSPGPGYPGDDDCDYDCDCDEDLYPGDDDDEEYSDDTFFDVDPELITPEVDPLPTIPEDDEEYSDDTFFDVDPELITPEVDPLPTEPEDDEGDNNQPPVIDQEVIDLVVEFLAEVDADNPIQITTASVINHREILSAIADVIEEIDGLPDGVSIDVVSQENTIFTENKVENVTVLITMNPTYPIFDQTIYFEIVSADGDETLPQTSAVMFDVLIAGLALGGLGLAVVLNKKRDLEIS